MSWVPPKGVLGELVRSAREDVAARRKLRPTLDKEVAAKSWPRPGRFVRALSREVLGQFPLICEVKRASPSAGRLEEGADAPKVAQSYVVAGARCVSVLTEQRRFGGSLEDLRAVRSAVKVPLLRKDFIVEPWMVWEAADAGADCILLIAAALAPDELLALAKEAESVGLDVLLELIYERDLEVLGLRDWSLVGVNARDLETLEMDDTRFGRLAPKAAAPGRLLVAESGIRSPHDVTRYRNEGAQAALVGESLMRAVSREAAVRALVEAT